MELYKTRIVCHWMNWHSIKLVSIWQLKGRATVALNCSETEALLQVAREQADGAFPTENWNWENRGEEAARGEKRSEEGRDSEAILSYFLYSRAAAAAAARQLRVDFFRRQTQLS